MLYCTGKEGSKEQRAQTERIEERKREERKAALVTLKYCFRFGL